MEEDNIMDCIDLDKDYSSAGECRVFSPNKSNAIEIKVGMEFSSIEEVQDLYAQFAKDKGFQIRRRNSRQRMVQFTCYREGFHKLQIKEKSRVAHRYTKTSRIGCRACLYTTLDCKMNMWRISKFVEEHNHDMVSPKSRKYLRINKSVPTSAKCLAQVFSNEGIPVGKVTNVLNPNPEEAEFTRKDCYNFITCMRRKLLDCGDAQSVQLYCIRQQQLNSNFRYAIQVDNEDRMVNFFWVDARSRVAYQTFGDVISFDTTYKTNKYSMPFAPFVGIDNHKHTILFGCALLQDETESSFIWLFNAWLDAMDGKAPISIITDQDMAIMNAVRHVFPTAKHRLCIWHICKKFPERLAHIYHDKSSFKASLNSCIHDSLSVTEFEESWQRLVSEYGLNDNEWFNNLFSNRHIWVPVFCKDVFFGGMNTTGRSESINAFFDSFVHSGTTLKEFVEKYGHALEKRYETFRRAEFDTRHKVPIFVLGMGLEEDAGRIYTSEVFKEFHIQLTRSLSYNREVLVDGEPVKVYRVKSRLSKGNGVVVEYNIHNQDAKCECMFFQFEGLLCRHIISVLHMHSIDYIPSQFILNRWTKDVGRVLWDAPLGRDRCETKSVDCFQLKLALDDLYDMCEKSQVVLDYVKKHVTDLHTNASVMFHLGNENALVSQVVGTNSSVHDTSSRAIQDPNITQTKGRRKAKVKRIKSGLEMSNEATIRCFVCFSIGHNKRTCPKERVDS